MDKILNVVWPVIAAAATALLTPVVVVLLATGRFADAAFCILFLVPFLYVLMSFHLGRVLESQFQLSDLARLDLASDKPMHSGTIWFYGRRRRQILARLLEHVTPSEPAFRARFRRLVSVHRGLEALFLAEMLLLVAVLVVENMGA
jgi:hypothetical protein